MMTNNCYCPRGVYDVYLGGNPVKLNLYCRKRIRNRLFYRLFRGRMYWFSHDVQHEIQHEIHEIYTTVTWKIHRMEGIVCRIAKLEASIIGTLLLRPDSNSQLTF